MSRTQPSPPSLCYVLASTELWGGVRAVFEQAERLAGRGWRVSIATPDARPDWFDVGVDFVQMPALSTEHLPPADCYVVTFWTTVEAALATDSAAIHLCQGYEGDLTDNVEEQEQIARTYELPTYKVATSQPVRDLIESRFEQPCRLIRYGVDAATFNDHGRSRPDAPQQFRVVVPGPFQLPAKRIPLALAGVKAARDSGLPVALVRVSQFPQSDAERELFAADEYHTRLSASQMADLFRTCDLVLATSTPAEGFGLPPLEAMACGCVPVLSAIPSFSSYGRTAGVEGDYALFADGQATEISAGLRRLIDDAELRHELRAVGARVAAAYDWPLVLDDVEAAYRAAWSEWERWQRRTPVRLLAAERRECELRDALEHSSADAADLREQLRAAEALQQKLQENVESETRGRVQAERHLDALLATRTYRYTAFARTAYARLRRRAD